MAGGPRDAEHQRLQDGSRDAWFEHARRLVVESGGTVTACDPGEHRIRGVGQQQGGGKPMTFEADQGPLDLGDLEAR